MLKMKYYIYLNYSMGGQNSKIKIKNKDIRCSVVNNFVYHDNEITFESPNNINKFNIVHTYGINGEKWIDNEFLNIDFLYDDKNYLVKYRQSCLSINIYFKNR